MRILEDSELGYSIDDIISAVEDELGFTLVKENDSSGYFLLGRQIKLQIKAIGNEVNVQLEFPDKTVDISEDPAQAELYSTSIESALQILDIINRMTTE